MDSDNFIEETKQWIANFIIAYNICPFAKRVFINQQIAYRVILDTELKEQLYKLIAACVELDNQTEIETSLLIFPESFKSFDDYLDFLSLSNLLLQKQGYEGIYQLASFHPDYCFDGVDEDDASHFTNRSPYPMLHIIREASLETALQTYPNPEEIPLRNIKTTRKLGKDVLQQLLKHCKEK